MIRKFFKVMVFCAIFLCSCGADKDGGLPAEAVYRKISAEEAREIMQSAGNYILLDVRTEQEYMENRIDGAVLIPDYELTARAESELPDKNAVILIYCRSGRRSANAAQELTDMGYMNIYDFGGILDWSYDTVSDYD